MFRKPSTEPENRARLEEICRKLEGRYPDLDTVRPEELEELREAGEVWIVDVRTPEERAVSRIPGAISIAEVEADPERYRGRRVVAYCTVGGRSGAWADRMRLRGWDVANLRGSILGWTHAGLELEGDDGPTRRVHVMEPRWDFAADGYEGVF